MNESVVFNAAVKLPKEQRAGFLDAACAGNPQLRAEVDGLLREHDSASSFMIRPVAQPPATTDSSNMYRPGALVAGRYKLLEQIGEGGMGAVWVAEQTEPVRRRVALKLIKPGMDTKQVLSRFAAERQALALMDHPNIAKVYDGGMTEEGRPFFVMEYVKGVPITDYCDQAKLSIEERLKLFLPICQAVQHAHQKGIIHRDLKPSNLLVCLYDGQPVPKVIDFGLAKATSQPLTEHTLYTAHGLMVGTPLYMSPEQAEFNNLDVDTRTDIYSLGVILYELLTGTTPLEKQKLKDAAFAEILRLIKEEEPPKPSTKLSGSATLPAIAAQRGLEPAQLSRVVRGELDWIVMKSLEKERSRRYETASSLTRDLERYLNDEPVEACPPSLRYKFSKFARRNMRALVTATLFGIVVLSALLTVAGSVGYVWSYLGTRQAVVERRIELALEKAQSAYEQGDLAQAAAAVNQAEGHSASAEIRPEFVEHIRQWVADLAMVQQLEKIHLEKAAAIKDEHFDPASALVPYNKAFQDYGLNFGQLGPLDAAQRLHSSAIKKHLVAAVDDWAFFSDDAQRGRLLAITRQTDPDPWRNRLRDAVERSDPEQLQQLAADEACLVQPAITLAYLGGRFQKLGLREPAMSLLRQAHRRYPDDFWINEYLGNQLLLAAQPDEAAVHLRLASGKFSRSPAAQNSLGVALAYSGKASDAAEEFRAAIRLKPDFGMPHHNLGSALERLGKLNEAEAAYREAARLRPQDGTTQAALAGLLAEHQNKVAEAEQLYRTALASAPNDWVINAAYLELLETTGRLAAVAAEIHKRLLGEPDHALLHRIMGELLAQRQTWKEAEAEYRETIRLNPSDAYAHTKLGVSLLEQDKPKEAEAACRDAVQLEPELVWAHFYLGAALNKQQMWAEAEVPIRKAIELNPNLTYAYTLLTTALRNQNKSTADIRRPAALALPTMSVTTGPGISQRSKSFVGSYPRGQFELGLLDYYAGAILSIRGGLFASRPGGLASGLSRPTSPVFEEAQLRATIQRNPKDWVALERLGALLISQNNSGAATAMWEAVCADPSNPKFHTLYGVALGGNYTYAEAAFREAIRLDPNYAEAHRRLCSCLDRQGKLDDSIAVARAAIRLDPNNGDQHINLGWCLRRKGDLTGAEAEYREALRLTSNSPSTHFELGWVLKRLGKESEAAEQFERAKQLSPTTFGTNVSAGNHSARVGDLRQAAQHFQNAFQEDRDDCSSATRAALLLLFQGDNGGYEKACRQMLERFGPTKAEMNVHRVVQTCLITPDIAGDLPTLTRLADQLVGSALVVSSPRERGLVAYRNGKWEETLRWCRQSREENARLAANRASGATSTTASDPLYNAQNFVMEAMALHQQGKAAEARKTYELAARTAGNASAPYSLGTNWKEWLTYEITRREAEKLLGVQDNSGWPQSPARGRVMAGGGDWKAGAAELARACESPAASSLDFIAAGTALARAEDREGYRKHCQAMIERFGSTNDWQEIERTVKVCALAPFDVEIPGEMLTAVSKDLDDGKVTGYMAAWGNAARAHAAYRQGRYDDAAKWADSASQEPTTSPHAKIQGFLISAMAHKQRGDSAAAAARLAVGLEMRDSHRSPKLADGSLDERLVVLEATGWWDLLADDLLRREAMVLVGDVKPAKTAANSTSRANQLPEPLLSDAAVKSARRITGWVASWSPDGKRLVRNTRYEKYAEADLEIVDLETGATTKLCQGGKDSAWSPLPGGPIAFVRDPAGKGEDNPNEEIWLVQPDGSNLRKLASGGWPSWSNDGRLFFREYVTSSNITLHSVNPSDPKSSPLAFTTRAKFPTVSPDGMLAAIRPAGRPLAIAKYRTRETVLTVPGDSVGDTASWDGVLASWSSDGRYVGYGSVLQRNAPGLWLFDTKTGKTRLLASGALTCPRWSPDGKFIAADDRPRNELVILDVSSLKLENGLPAASPTENGSSQ
jgi:eukaryotic-like serine/threonine-protein kinase